MIAEYDNGAAPGSPSREYVYNSAGGATTGLLAMIAGGATTYYHQDHLSVRLTTDGTVGSATYGRVLSQQGSYPYGESWYQSGAANQFVFTSYSRDSESGLDYALARYYDSRTGTFCSADPLAGSPDDPQSWNRYAYARNNPIMITDPSGKGWLSWLTDIGLGVAAIVLPEIAPAWFSAGSSIFGATQGFAFSADGSFIGASAGAVSTWGSSTLASVTGGALAGATAASATNPPQAPQNPASPQTTKMKDCPPTNAHGVQNNLPTRAPTRVGAYGAPETPGTAAIDRSQWLPPGSSNWTSAQANAYINQYKGQISGFVPNSSGGYTQVFKGVSDNMGPASGVAKLIAKYPGRVLFELPGGKDLGNVNNMRFRVPSKMPCPHS